jgi:hypothetical protein
MKLSFAVDLNNRHAFRYPTDKDYLTHDDIRVCLDSNKITNRCALFTLCVRSLKALLRHACSTGTLPAGRCDGSTGPPSADTVGSSGLPLGVPSGPSGQAFTTIIPSPVVGPISEARRLAPDYDPNTWKVPEAIPATGENRPFRLCPLSCGAIRFKFMENSVLVGKFSKVTSPKLIGTASFKDIRQSSIVHTEDCLQIYLFALTCNFERLYF